MALSSKLCILISSVSLAAAISGCGGEEAQAPDPTPTPVIESQAPIKYQTVLDCFSDFSTADAISVDATRQRLHLRISCDLPATETAPEGWSDAISAFTGALPDAFAAAQDYGFPALSVELLDPEGTVLANGRNDTLGFDLYSHEDLEETFANPPTITLSEYSAIQVGMPLSDVERIIGGPGSLSAEISEPTGVIGTIQSLTWYAADGIGSAVITFDDYIVVSKLCVALE